MNKYLFNTNNSSDDAHGAASCFSCANMGFLSTCIIAVLIFILSIANAFFVIMLNIVLIMNVLFLMKKQPIFKSLV